MFTLDQINAANAKVKSGADFPAYIQDLIRLGVTGYSTYLADGHTEFAGEKGYQLSSPPRNERMAVAATTNVKAFEQHLQIHQQGGTDFMTFCKRAAGDGVEKWTVSMKEMTVTYYDKEGQALLKEEIPVVNQPVR